MKNPVNSTTAKYLVNILMVGFFVALAYTGLFGKGGPHEGRPGERHEGWHERFEQGREQFERREMDKAAGFTPGADFRGEHGEKGLGDHDIYGIVWLVLMALHTYQNWEWYKKLFSPKRIMKTKLLTATVVAFVFLALSSIALLFHLVPRGFINVKEIHEISGYLMVGFVLIHTVQRVKWYVKSTRKLFGAKPEPVAAAQL